MSDSNSEANQTQVSEQQDNRIASAAGSVNLVASRSSVGDINIVSTDHDSVAKSFDFAKAISMGAADEIAASGARQVAVTKSAMASVADAYKDTSKTVAAAYTTAKAGEQKIMVAGALLIGGVVALQALKRA